jgi:glucosyl-dolichyl phosphate glucuronosyltransferase
MSIIISVVICTYNRADLLSGALKSICQQTLAPDKYEILVVDNASTDHTAEIVLKCQQEYPEHKLRRICESRQGLGYARNTAIKEAKGNYIAYLDDDARAKSDWLESASRHLGANNPLHCLGGVILPFYTTGKPSWFQDKYESRLWGDKERWLSNRESLSGSNMIWSKDIIQSIGGFGEAVGVKGKNISVGEETLAFRHLWQAEQAPVVIYDPTLVVYHWVPPNKMKVSYYIKRALITGQATFQIDRKPGLGWRMRTLLRSGGAATLYTLKAMVRLPRYHHWQNWIIEECTLATIKVGTCLAACEIKMTMNRQ